MYESSSASPLIYRRDQLDWPEEKQLHSLDLDLVAQLSINDNSGDGSRMVV